MNQKAGEGDVCNTNIESKGVQRVENEILGIELILCSGLPAETRGKDCRNVATTTGRIGQRTKSDGWRTNTIRS